MSDKKIQTTFSEKAVAALAKRSEPLNIELELYFSCLIRKRLRFVDVIAEDGIVLESPRENVNLYFRPVMTKVCSVDEVINVPEMERFPIAKPEAFIPKWVKVDYKRGQWLGEFGY